MTTSRCTTRPGVRWAAACGATVLMAAALAGCGDKIAGDTNQASGNSDPAAAANEPKRESSPPRATGDTTKPSVTPKESPSAADTSKPARANEPDGDASASRDGTPRCHTVDLDVRLGQVDAATGNRYAPLIFENTSDHVCHLQGWPGVTVRADGEQVGPDARLSGGNPHRVIQLQPGEVASTTVHWATATAGGCSQESQTLRIYPPGAYEPLTTPADIRLCGDVFTVRNLTAGADGTASG